MYTVENWGSAPIEGRAMEKTDKVVSDKTKEVQERVKTFKTKLRQKEIARIEARKK